MVPGILRAPFHLSLQGDWILSGKDCEDSKSLHLFLYSIKYENVGLSKDPLLTQVSEFAVLFGNELDEEVSCFFVSFT